MGVRHSQRELGARPADDRLRPPLHRLGRRHCLRARRLDRLHDLGVQSRYDRARCDHRRCRATNGRAFAYFGDSEANLYALDAASGKLVWKTKVDPHPTARITGAPQLYEGRLYVPLTGNEELTGGDPAYPCCTFRGNITAVDARTGKLIWKAYGIAKVPGPSAPGTSHAKFSPAGGAMWSAPTIDAKLGRLYTGTGDAYVDPADEGTDAIVAFDLASGKRLWLQQKTSGDVFNFGCFQAQPMNCPPKVGPDFDFGSSVILQNLGGGHRVLLAGQKSGVLFALDPDNGGKELWHVRVGHGGGLGGIEWGFATDGTNAYVALSDIPSSLSPPKPGAVVPPSGGLFAIDIRTGQTRVEDDAAQARVRGPAGMQRGTTRRSHSRSRRRLFRLDGWPPPRIFREDRRDPVGLRHAAQRPTVNGVKAHGGSMSGSGPTVSGNMVFVTSGFTGTSGMPGNLLLAFEAPGSK